MTGKTILPSITAQMEAQEEGNRLNVINQLVISTKEDVVEDITKLVGSDVTNAILHTASSSNHKSIDEFALYKVMKVAINGANQPSTNNVLEQLIKTINHNFDFCKKVSVNMELMQSNLAQMAMYGIVIGIPQLMLRLLANIKTATKSNYGCEFAQPCMPSVKSTRTTMHRMWLCTRSLSRTWWVLMACRCSRTHQHQVQKPHIQLPNRYPTSK